MNIRKYLNIIESVGKLYTISTYDGNMAAIGYWYNRELPQP